MTLTQVVTRLLETVHLPVEWAPTVTATIAGIVLLFLWIMPVVMYMIWWLRRLLGWMQSRFGPNTVGPAGLLQTPADAIKLLTKEDIIPAVADRWVFVIAPALVFVPAYLVYVTIPFGPKLVAQDLDVGIVYVAAIASITVLGIVLAAWSSNNKYALISAFRSAAQMVSYEVPLVLAILGPVLVAQALTSVQVSAVASDASQGVGAIVDPNQLSMLSLRTLVYVQQNIGWFILLQPIVFICFIAAAMAENNVTPFDIVEAESEIVAGFHVEYSGMKFALFFLAEFANTFTVAALTTVLFLGGWSSPLPILTTPIAQAILGGITGILPAGSLLFELVRAVLTEFVSPFFWFTAKAFALVSVIFWVRATLPRVRVDQLMDFGWKVLIPITLLNITVNGMWVALGWPVPALAALNWVVVVVVLAIGATKRLPKVQGTGLLTSPPSPLPDTGRGN
jgi:NADH-quinone oxidoreductase subunit H